MRSKYTPIIEDTGELSIGCIAKTAEEWIRWLESDEEYETSRKDPNFLLIEAHIHAALNINAY